MLLAALVGLEGLGRIGPILVPDGDEVFLGVDRKPDSEIACLAANEAKDLVPWGIMEPRMEPEPRKLERPRSIEALYFFVFGNMMSGWFALS